MKKKKIERTNWRIVSSNVKEANDELNKLLKKISEDAKPSHVELEIAIRHAMHHLNTAWNARHAKLADYRNMTETRFKRWGKFPEGLDDIEKMGE